MLGTIRSTLFENFSLGINHFLVIENCYTLECRKEMHCAYIKLAKLGGESNIKAKII